MGLGDSVSLGDDSNPMIGTLLFSAPGPRVSPPLAAPLPPADQADQVWDVLVFLVRRIEGLEQRVQVLERERDRTWGVRLHWGWQTLRRWIVEGRWRRAWRRS